MAKNVRAAPANTKKRAPRSTLLNVYIGTVRPSRVIRMFEIRCDKQRHFACLAFFVLSPFFELIAAFTAPINAGATDTATMPKTITSK